MKLLPLLSLCLLSWSAATFGEQHEPVKVIVMEDRDAILPCSLGSGENIESMLFEWRQDYQKDGSKDVFMYNNKKQDLSRQSEQFRGRVFHFSDELKNGNASIKITKTKLADRGNYTCIFPHLQPERKFNVELVVAAVLKDRSRDLKGAAPKPSVTVLKTNHGALLQCEVRGASPKPQLQWQHSDRNLLPAKELQVSERGGSYDIILQATVTKTDTYRCVVTQEEINHQTQAEIYVPPIGAAPGQNKESSNSFIGLVIALSVVSTILLIVVLAVLYDKGFLCKKASGTNPQSGTSTKEESPLHPANL